MFPFSHLHFSASQMPFLPPPHGSYKTRKDKKKAPHSPRAMSKVSLQMSLIYLLKLRPERRDDNDDSGILNQTERYEPFNLQGQSKEITTPLRVLSENC